MTNLEIAAWQEKIRQEFRHDLYVMPRAAIIAALEPPENAWLCRQYLDLAFADESDIESLVVRGRIAAATSLLRWKEEVGYEPDKQIQLTLRLESEKQEQKGTFLNVEEVCNTACYIRGLVLKGPPGAGKTITLLQLATVLTEASEGPIPIVISLLEQWIQDESVRVQEPHSRMSWTNWYAGALAKLNCDEAATVLLRLLSDREYFGDASYALLQMVRTEEQPSQTQVSFGPDYRGVWQARQEREVHRRIGQDKTKRVEYAQAIRAALAARLAEGERVGESPIFLPFDLTQATTALAHLDEEDCIPILLRCGSHEALEILVLKGIKLPGTEAFAVLDPIITKIENEPMNANQDHWYVAVRCLSILLFGDNPGLGVERIRHTLPRILNSYHATNLIHVLGLCRAPEAAEFLAELIGNHAVLRYRMWDYVNALAESRQPQGRRALLKLLDELGKNSNAVGSNRFDAVREIGEALARVTRENREVWAEIQCRCEGALNRSQQEALVWMLEKFDTEEAALTACLLLRDESGFHTGQFGMWIIQNALFYRVEAETANSYYLQPKSANAFRKRLMNQALHDPTRQRSSLTLLAEVETRRLEVGKPPDEPRHPDIAILPEMNVPWPLL